MQTSSDISETASALRLAVTRTARRLRQEALGAEGSRALSPTNIAALATLERHGPLTPSELADLERIKRPTATRALACLADAGLIDRSPDPDDGRSSLVTVNSRGSAQLRRLRRRKNAYLARRMQALPAEEAEVLQRAAEILERMLAEEPR